MKKFISIVLVLLMAFATLAGCGGRPAAKMAARQAARRLKHQGRSARAPYGEAAVYGLAVRNGAQLYIDQVNAQGGVNGKQSKPLFTIRRATQRKRSPAFTRMVDEGITALIGDVLTDNTIAVVGEAYPIGLPMITASATAAAVTYDAENKTVFNNVFRTCFIDPFQAKKWRNTPARC